VYCRATNGLRTARTLAAFLASAEAVKLKLPVSTVTPPGTMSLLCMMPYRELIRGGMPTFARNAVDVWRE
jgi:hypothetical protein